jgi:hypothetical protein
MGLQRAIVSSLRCLFAEFCCRRFRLAVDSFLCILRSIGALGRGRSDRVHKFDRAGTCQPALAAQISEYEARRLFRAVEETPGGGLRFEDFWVVMKAMAYRLVMVKGKETSAQTLMGDQLLWTLVRERCRLQFALPKAEMAGERRGWLGSAADDENAAASIAPWSS